MAKAVIQFTTIATGAPAPRPLTQWIEHLKRRRIAAKKARAATKRQRPITEQRLGTAERLLADIIAGADVIGMGTDLEGYPAAYLLLTLHRGAFDDLSAFGAEREDLEESHDAERDADDEPSVGVDTPDHDPCDDGEQREYQPHLDGPIIAAARKRFDPAKLSRSHHMGPNLIFRTVDPETKRAGMWVLQRKAGAR